LRGLRGGLGAEGRLLVDLRVRNDIKWKKQQNQN
jgi:hypothetical protein